MKEKMQIFITLFKATRQNFLGTSHFAPKSRPGHVLLVLFQIISISVLTLFLKDSCHIISRCFCKKKKKKIWRCAWTVMFELC